MSGMEEEDIRCPECGLLTSVGKEECPNCGFELYGWIEEKEMEELLSKVDDETYELKDLDSDSLVEEIKKFGVKREEKEIESGRSKEEEGEVTYECPLCGSEVEEDAEECSGCGAIFRD